MTNRQPDPIDLMMDGKWQEALDAFQSILDSMDGHDPMGLIDDQMAYCRAMLAEQK